jgi:hypothetical protein
MKLSAKFARQESEEMRQARVARRRVAGERADAIRRMLNVPLRPPESRPRESREPGSVITSSQAVVCPDCNRTFSLPMHLGRHRKAKHDRSDAA